MKPSLFQSFSFYTRRKGDIFKIVCPLLPFFVIIVLDIYDSEKGEIMMKRETKEQITNVVNNYLKENPNASKDDLINYVKNADWLPEDVDELELALLIEKVD